MVTGRDEVARAPLWIEYWGTEYCENAVVYHGHKASACQREIRTRVFNSTEIFSPYILRAPFLKDISLYANDLLDDVNRAIVVERRPSPVTVTKTSLFINRPAN